MISSIGRRAPTILVDESTPEGERLGLDITEGLSERRRRLARWVAREIMPHEARVRAWLRRSRLDPDDIDEVIQETYCRLSMLDSVEHIDRPDAYFFSIAGNLLARRLRRQKVVPFETIAEIEAYRDDAPTQEDVAFGHSDWLRMMGLISKLPSRCRQVVRLRKIEGWSQREIAEHLGISEKAVEKHVSAGIGSIRRAWIDGDQAADRLKPAIHSAGSR
ncbi:RNA polymerase sigma factor [Sphingomonas oryzagri]|uniref:Sigma-70 family RNA polymerase sigma factor n=1 Tax=Sphingomonas oryzagri TaxID=3042314 RepID=A0ABT6N2M2_9SPHN|nr:sigma-70 family RNA polymerase sigma factor [Sphingomonas oryzagri]MDH7639328.1 sigma-70 family RNA polymerase sigma factor [Sphingomonas oryzagri]